MEAQRYPADFDGIISECPVVDRTGSVARGLYNAQQFFPDPNKLDEALVSEDLLLRLHADVLKKCDERDGLKDGIIDDPRACSFDLSQVNYLSRAQRQALQRVYDGPRNKHGQLYPGMPLGSEHKWSYWVSGTYPTVLKERNAPNYGFWTATYFSKYFVFHDPSWDYSSYDLSDWERDSRLAGSFLNAKNTDLSEFKARGGKLIMWHGWCDGLLTPLASINYFEQVERSDATVRDYFRLFLLPGVAHCEGGEGPDNVDWLAHLTKWVEQGRAPNRVIASKKDEHQSVLMTRAIYPYPLRAVYKGTGYKDDANNFGLPNGSE